MFLPNVVVEVEDAGDVRAQTAHEGITGRRTHGDIAVGAGEDATFGSKAVKCWCEHVLLTVGNVHVSVITRSFRLQPRLSNLRKGLAKRSHARETISRDHTPWETISREASCGVRVHLRSHVVGDHPEDL